MHVSELDAKKYGNKLVKKILDSGLDIENLFIEPKSLTLFEKTKSGVLKFHGCALCFNSRVVLDNLGKPIIEDKYLKGYENVPETEILPDQIKINMWFCPECNNLVESLMPENLRK
jgi:hypothetical protein